MLVLTTGPAITVTLVTHGHVVIASGMPYFPEEQGFPSLPLRLSPLCPISHAVEPLCLSLQCPFSALPGQSPFSLGLTIPCHCPEDQGLLPLMTQVLSLKQSAEVLVRCDAYRPLAEDLLSHIAAEYGFPTKQELICNTADSDQQQNDWQRFWQYTEATNPYISLHPDYVLVGKHKTFSEMSPTLY